MELQILQEFCLRFRTFLDNCLSVAMSSLAGLNLISAVIKAKVKEIMIIINILNNDEYFAASWTGLVVPWSGSSMCHNKNTIGKEDNGKPAQKTTRALSLVFATLEI